MGILDQYGKELKTGAPIRGEIAVDTLRNRYSTYPSSGMTPEKLAGVLREGDMGNVARQAELFEEMEEKDCHLASILGTRKMAVSGLRWEVLPASDSREDKKIAAAAKEMFDSLESLRDTLFDILDAAGKGFSMGEIMWDPTPAATWIREIKWVHQKKFTFYAVERTLTYPRLLTDASPLLGEELPANKFVFHRHRARSGITPRGGLLRPVSFMWLFKNFDIKDWLIFNDLYSVPMRIGKYKPGSAPDEINILKSATLNVAVDAAAVISDNTVIELLEAKNRGDSQAFQALADFCDRAMTKAVLGHTGAAESTAGKLGSEDQAKEVRQDILEADAEALETCIKFQVLKPWVGFNFGWDKGIPKFKLHYEAPEDLEKAAKVYGILVKDMGFGGIPESHIYDRFGIPLPKAGEAVVKAAVAAPVAGDPGAVGANPAPVVANTLRRVQDLGAIHVGAVREPPLQGMINVTGDRLDPVTGAWLDAVKQVVNNTASLEELRDAIMNAYPDLPIEESARIMAEQTMKASMIGRLKIVNGEG